MFVVQILPPGQLNDKRCHFLSVFAEVVVFFKCDVLGRDARCNLNVQIVRNVFKI